MRFIQALAVLSAFAAVGAAPVDNAALKEREALPAAQPEPVADPILDKKGYGSYSPYQGYGLSPKLYV